MTGERTTAGWIIDAEQSVRYAVACLEEGPYKVARPDTAMEALRVALIALRNARHLERQRA